ncbi:MAG: MFS transporter [Bacteroidetes bacterium]|nr:MFS transporter [Bacteroidota bacterium]
MGRHFSFAVCALAYLFGGTVSMLLSANLPVVVQELSAPTSGEFELANTGAYLNASFLYGWMLGGLLLGVVCDRIGRIKTLALATGLYGLFTCLVYAVPDWQILLLYRFLAGFGVGGVLLVSTVYISEIWPAENRSVMLGILAVMFPVGIVLSGALTAGFSHWRQAFLLGFIPLGLGAVILFFLPESKVWQTTKEMPVQERSIWPLLAAPAYRRNLVLGSIVYGAVLIGLWGLFSWIPTWVQELVKGATDGQKERGFSMMLLGLGGIGGGLFSGILMQKWGSRTTLLVTFTGLIGMCALLFLTNKGFSPLIYVEMAVLAMFFGISQGALSGYVPALFPAEIRATATGVCFNICRFFTATAVFFVGTLVEVLGGFGNALLTFAWAFVIALFAAWYSPETEIHS